MKKLFLFTILILLSNCQSWVQKSFSEFTITNPERIKDYKKELILFTKIEELQVKKVDFIAYKDYSIGSINLITPNANSCQNSLSHDSIYLIWKENNKEYIQMFDNYGSFYPQELDDLEVTTFVNNNFEIIKSEKIKYYQTKKNTISTISHSRFKELLLSKSSNEIYSNFDVYDLTSESESPNINYEYNNNLKLIHLNNLIELEIKKLDSLKLFKRELATCK